MSLPEDETQIRKAVPEGSQILKLFDNVYRSNGPLSEGQRMTFDESGQGALGSADESCSVMETGPDADASDREVCTFLSTVFVEVPNEQTSNHSRLGAVAASLNVFLKRPSASAIWD
ncbi:unnamed protein product [Allacma fusca]|uniref:Uncharacterized protein n=1 Tax=Allacma fusca TaxID=39272 RepID=A0A8J2PIF7_9HEXA|nr:unnamed protein product [Allacma fusca]